MFSSEEIKSKPVCFYTVIFLLDRSQLSYQVRGIN